MTTTRLVQHITASRANVYRAITTADSVARWMVPDGMRSHIHSFDPREGGTFRISLTYDEPTGAGKTTAHTDTYHGRFVELVPDVKVVQSIEFESEDPRMLGEMVVRLTLTEVPNGTELRAEHENVPPGISPADNELGWSISLGKLARLVEEEAGGS